MKDYMHELFNTWQSWVDAVAVSTVIAALTAILPVASGVFGLVWLGYRIKEIRLSIKLKQKELES